MKTRQTHSLSNMDGSVLGEETGSYGSMACTAFFALLRAERRPYKRAQNEVSTSILSWTRSSFTPELSMTMSLRPWAASAASTYSGPKRMNRSRCSTTIV
jgi:hypothetical protein